MDHKDVESITLDVVEKYQQFVNPTQVALLKLAGFDVVEASAQGTRIYDLSGDSYLDCFGGFGVFSLGHRHPKVIDAVKTQLDLMPLPSKTLLNKPLADLCAELARIAPGSLQYSFICNSGAESVEGAIKISRIATGKTDVVSTIGGFHGKTMGALSATGKESFRLPAEPLLPGFSHVPWNDAGAVAAAITDRTAAVIVEPVQGEGGIHVPSDDYLPSLRRICSETGVLLIVDEVQTGIGRTGKMLAVEHWGVQPDILCLAKALGGGVMPIGAIVSTADIWTKVFRANPLIHTSTFGGNELACVAALAAIRATEEEGLPARAAEQGAYFLRRLQEVQGEFPDVLLAARGLGLMLGLELADPDIGMLLIGALAKHRVLVAYALNNVRVIRLEPPLMITREEIDTVIDALREAVQDTMALLASLG